MKHRRVLRVFGCCVAISLICLYGTVKDSNGGHSPIFWPSLYIFAVGIDQYTLAQGGGLALTAADTRDFADCFHFDGDFVGGIHKTVLLNAQANKASIEAALLEAALEIHPSDTFVFFYSGKGGQNPQVGQAVVPADSSVVPSADFYLLPSDADPKRLGQTAINASELGTWLARVSSQNQLIVLDTCNSSYAFEALSSRVIEHDPSIAELLGTNLLVIASDTTEYESEDMKHGALTFALLDGLSGKASLSDGGTITAREIEADLYRRMLEISRDKWISQLHPRAIARGSGFFVTLYDLNKAQKPEMLPKIVTLYDAQISDLPQETRGATPAPLDSQSRAQQREGNDYALLIATDDYQEWSQLKNPVFDAEAIAQSLVKNYTFDPKNLEILYDPSRGELIQTIKQYRDRKYDMDDQLFVFVAGHRATLEFTGDSYLVTKDSPARLTLTTEDSFFSWMIC